MFDDKVTPESEDKEIKDDVQDDKNQPSEDQSWFEVDGRKFDKESAKTYYENASSHIGRLEQENAELREQQKQLDKLEKLEALLQQQADHQNLEGKSPEPDDTKSVDIDELTRQVYEQVTGKLTTQQQEAAREQNRAQAGQKVKAAYGENYADKLVEIGQDYGLDQKGIMDMAETNPKMFERIFLPKASKSDLTPRSTHVPPRTGSNEESPYKSATDVLLKSKSARERTEAVAALLNL